MHPDIPRSLPLVLALTTGLLGAMALPASAQEASPAPSAHPSAASSAAPSGAPAPIDECVEPQATAEPFADAPLTMPEDFRIALFDGVWEGIRDYYWDPDMAGLDWDAVGDEYAQLIIGSEDAYQVYELLQEMVGQLDDPYTGFFTPEDLGDSESDDPTYGGIGALLDTSAAGEDSSGLRILYVFDDSSALDAGIRARDSIIGVEGDPCARIAEIRGPAGTDVTLTVVSPGEEPRDITLERRQIDPVVRPEARRLEADPRSATWVCSRCRARRPSTASSRA